LNNVPCWGGQTIAAGCNQNFNQQTRLYTAQNLSGTQLIRAPAWQINFGFNYEMPLMRDYTLTFSNNNSYFSRFPTFLATGRPNDDTFQSAYVKVDLGVSLKSPDELWEIAVIGKNINDKVTAGNCSVANIANGVVLGGEITGSTGRGPAGIDEKVCWADTGRELWLRLTVRPFASRK
jgi:iron complex outermembrane receptor protein